MSDERNNEPLAGQIDLDGNTAEPKPEKTPNVSFLYTKKDGTEGKITFAQIDAMLAEVLAAPLTMADIDLFIFGPEEGPGTRALTDEERERLADIAEALENAKREANGEPRQFRIQREPKAITHTLDTFARQFYIGKKGDGKDHTLAAAYPKEIIVYNIPDGELATPKLRRAINIAATLSGATPYRHGHPFTLRQFHYYFGRRNNPGRKDYEEYMALFKMAKKTDFKATLPNAEEDTPEGKVTFEYEGSFISWDTVKMVNNFKIVDAAIRVLVKPPSIAFAEAHGKVTTLPAEIYATPWAKTNNHIAIEDYLIDRLAQIKKNIRSYKARLKGYQNKLEDYEAKKRKCLPGEQLPAKPDPPRKPQTSILFDTIAKECRLPERTADRLPEDVKKPLAHFMKIKWLPEMIDLDEKDPDKLAENWKKIIKKKGLDFSDLLP